MVLGRDRQLNVLVNMKGIDKANAQLKQTESVGNKAAGGIGAAFKKITPIIATMGITLTAALAVGKITEFVKEVSAIGVAVIETRSLIAASFGQMQRDIEEWSETSIAALTLTKLQAQETAAVFFNIFQGMKLNREEAFKLSTAYVDLISDLSSFNRALFTQEEILEKVRAGATGEFEGLKAIGILIKEETIKNQAYADGLADIGDKLDDATKAQATFNAIQRIAGAAIGDTERTIDSAAGKIAVYEKKVAELKEEIGERMVPVTEAWIDVKLDLVAILSGELPQSLKIAGDAIQDEIELIKEAGRIATEEADDITDALSDSLVSITLFTQGLGGLSRANIELTDTADDAGEALLRMAQAARTAALATAGVTDIGLPIGKIPTALSQFGKGTFKEFEQIQQLFVQKGILRQEQFERNIELGLLGGPGFIKQALPELREVVSVLTGLAGPQITGILTTAGIRPGAGGAGPKGTDADPVKVRLVGPAVTGIVTRAGEFIPAAGLTKIQKVILGLEPLSITGQLPGVKGVLPLLGPGGLPVSPGISLLPQITPDGAAQRFGLEDVSPLLAGPGGLPISPFAPIGPSGRGETVTGRNQKRQQMQQIILAAAAAGIAGGGRGAGAALLAGGLGIAGFAIGGPLGGQIGGAVGGLLSGLLFRRRQRPQLVEPIPVKVMNFDDNAASFLKATQQALARGAGGGIDRLEGLRQAQIQTGAVA